MSRDDEDGDDGDDTASESYLPGGLYPATFDEKMPVCSTFLYLSTASELCAVQGTQQRQFLLIGTKYKDV